VWRLCAKIGFPYPWKSREEHQSPQDQGAE